MFHYRQTSARSASPITTIKIFARSTLESYSHFARKAPNIEIMCFMACPSPDSTLHINIFIHLFTMRDCSKTFRNICRCWNVALSWAISTAVARLDNPIYELIGRYRLRIISKTLVWVHMTIWPYGQALEYGSDIDIIVLGFTRLKRFSKHLRGIVT